MEEAMKHDEILVKRRKKKGRKRIIVDEDIKPGIYSLDWQDEEEGYGLYAVLRAGSEGNLRPDRLLAGLFETSGLDVDFVQIRRLRSWDGDDFEVQL